MNSAAVAVAVVAVPTSARRTSANAGVTRRWSVEPDFRSRGVTADHARLLDAGEQRLVIEGLHEVRIEPRSSGPRAIFFGPVARHRQETERSSSLGAQPFGELVPIHDRKSDVEDRDVE